MYVCNVCNICIAYSSGRVTSIIIYSLMCGLSLRLVLVFFFHLFRPAFGYSLAKSTKQMNFLLPSQQCAFTVGVISRAVAATAVLVVMGVKASTVVDNLDHFVVFLYT